MKTTFEPEEIERILAEADEVLQNVDSDIIKDMEDERRAQLEEHAQSLKRLKSEVQDKIGKEGTPASKPYSEGTHEAIEDIVKAMKTMATYLTSGKNKTS
jgi:CDGSH-type Zn-finger protein